MKANFNKKDLLLNMKFSTLAYVGTFANGKFQRKEVNLLQFSFQLKKMPGGEDGDLGYLALKHVVPEQERD